MNCLKNSRSVLSRLLRQPPAARSPPRPRCYYTTLRDRPGHPSPQPTQAPAARRCQHTGRWTVRRTSRRGGGSRWYEDERVAQAAFLVAVGGAAAVLFCRREAVPFTGRTRFVLLSPTAERWLGEILFEVEKRELGSKVLPPHDPRSVRVRRIASEVVRAARRADLKRDDDQALSQKNHGKKAAKAARRTQQDYIDGFNWEVIVVRENVVNAMCMPGGKIVVYTGLLNTFREDAEIATVLGHEVGHAVARHHSERLAVMLWFLILHLLISLFVEMPNEINVLSKVLLMLRFSRRKEMEADHVGLMLLAAAGYDPREAPYVYEKLGKLGGDSALGDYISTHPSSKKRSQLLWQEHVMNKALELYREVSTGQGTDRFPLDSGTQIAYGKK